MTPYKMLSARAIAIDIAAGRMKPGDALKQADLAIDQHEEKLRVFSHRAESTRPGKKGLPLAGVSVGIKDVFDTFDMPTCYGSKIYPDHQPVSDAALVTMLRQAGATIAGKTVTTEFAWFTPGATRNPKQYGIHPGRIVLRVCRWCCGWVFCCCNRHPDRRVNHSPGSLLWREWIQAQLPSVSNRG